MSNEFFRTMITEVKDENTNIVADGKSAGEFTGFLDTGCYMLNAVFSGSIYGGVADNKITGLAGENSVGKTFFILELVKSFQVQNPTGTAVVYDAEAAITKDMMIARGIDPERVIVSEPDTIEKFRSHAVKLLDYYLAKPKKSRPPMMFVLDSLGMLSSSKETGDIAEGKDTRDMTKSQLLRATFRVLTLKLAKAKVPMIVSNHTYAVIGAYVPTSEMSGGGGLKYAASSIAFLSKKKDKEGTDVVGNFIKVKMYKSRLSKENAEVTVKLSYKTGLDKYYGLVDLAEKAGIFKKVSTRYELPSGEKVFAKTIDNNPEKYYTKEILDQLDAAAKKFYAYGGDEDEPETIELIDETDFEDEAEA